MELLTAAMSLVAAATVAGTPQSDPFKWLEQLEDPRVLTWVRQQNDRSLAVLTREPRYEDYYRTALAMEEDKSRIPFGALFDGWIYNFWQDEQHIRGVLRRARLQSYEGATPEWQNLLDVDALGSSEGRSWVYKGMACLPPQARRCIIRLSDGGK